MLIVIKGAGERCIRDSPHPTREEITHYRSGNLCRCTGYKRIIEAIADAAERMNGGAK